MNALGRCLGRIAKFTRTRGMVYLHHQHVQWKYSVCSMLSLKIITGNHSFNYHASAGMNKNILNVYFIKLITSIYQQLTSCPGTVDQKNPLQSGSSNIYGINRVSSRTQFKTEKHKDKMHCLLPCCFNSL